MAFSPNSPRDFKQALANTLTDQEVDTSLRQPDSSPSFVYGALMLPTILKYHTDIDQKVRIQKSMTKATLHGYQLCQYADQGMPVIVQSDNRDHKVEGILVFGLNREQRNAIHELEGGLQKLASVQVQICQRRLKDNKHSMRMIDAGVFEWNPTGDSNTSNHFGLELIRGSMWDAEPFLQSPLCRHMVQSQDRRSREAALEDQERYL
ncbi:hypothetical protein MYU51_007059 [Penicillium brevicompactum]|uniref:uncharacterized protein n=1 Tax=Penicillium brevicompactum TaxID=5074 RepID=UPI00253FBB24|nr:uncharacterized protein N7506_002064 [Penicillium brevicompactum]KAJ5348811.1 hypothetical protein N7506_002064 [Penicillium brevicompactum]